MTTKRPRILVFGATGTIGRAVLSELNARNCDVIAVVRSGRNVETAANVRHSDVTNAASVLADAFGHENFDAVISCLASRTGRADDAWAIDHQAHLNILQAAQHTKTRHFILLSAICVQKPKLAFQHAKLAFEAALAQSGIRYSIVRPTAYFKSLSGQVARVKSGKPFLVFGDGAATACKPISDRDLARFIASCIDDVAKHNAILPIGGPGPAQTPRQQGEALFALLGRTPRFRHVPFALMDGIVAILAAGGRLSQVLANKAELARIGRYYATESMLVWNSDRQCYDAAVTPSFGQDRLQEYQQRLITGEETLDLREHAVF
jgi:divinyl chlorophyllide a 8-vinyl-reductase